MRITFRTATWKSIFWNENNAILNPIRKQKCESFPAVRPQYTRSECQCICIYKRETTISSKPLASRSTRFYCLHECAGAVLYGAVQRHIPNYYMAFSIFCFVYTILTRCIAYQRRVAIITTPTETPRINFVGWPSMLEL